MNAGPSCSSLSSVNLDLLHQNAEEDFLCSLEKFCSDNGDAADCYLAGKPPPGGEIPFVSRQLLSHTPLLAAIYRFKGRIIYLHGYEYRRPFTRVCPNVKAVCDLLRHCVDKNSRTVVGDLGGRIQELEKFLECERVDNCDDITFDNMIGNIVRDIAKCLTVNVHAAVIAREAAIEEGDAECLVTPAADKSPVPVGPGFPFITYCDPEKGILKLKEMKANGQVDVVSLRIEGEKQWHYVLQFVRANTNRIKLVRHVSDKRIKLRNVFRSGHDHLTFYRFTRAAKGSKAVYWLEQTQTDVRPK